MKSLRLFNHKIIFIILATFSFSANAQIGLAPLTNNSQNTFEIKSKEEISNMKEVADGTVYFNSTTKCINYFLAGNWYELCGNCVSDDDSIEVIQVNYKVNACFIEIKQNGDEEYVIQYDKKIIPFTGSEVFLTDIDNREKEAIIYRKTNCGLVSPTKIAINNPIFVNNKLEDYVDERTGKKYALIQIDSLLWMKSDMRFSPGKNGSTVIEGVTYQTWYVSKDVCPAGWRVPYTNELRSFGDNTLIANDMNNENLKKLGILFTYDGVVNPADGKLYGNGSNHYLWAADELKDGNASFLNIGNSGASIMSASPTSLMKIRCVKQLK